MSEHDVVKVTEGLPATVESIKSDLLQLGLKPGMTLFMNSSLTSMGWVVGGAQAVLMALDEVLTDAGTLVMPTFTGSNGEPSNWRDPPVPESCEMGIISETFRKLPGTFRSSHPALSIAARGRLAEKFVSNHSLDYSLGENSPLARVYENDGWVLLLGVGHGSNTSMHLGEYRADSPAYKEIDLGVAMMVDGKREWVTYKNINFNEDLMESIGADFDKEYPDIKIGKIGQAECRFFPQRALVDFTSDWLENRMPERIKPYGS